MIANTENLIALMDNHLHLKDYFLNNGVLQLENDTIETSSDNFFIVSDSYLNFKITEYYTTASLDLCLAYVFPHFSHKETKQLISMFEFHYNLFCKPTNKKEVIHIVNTDRHVTFSSKIIEIQATKKSVDVYQNCSFFESYYSTKKITIKGFHNILIKQIKKSLSIYFDDNISFVDSLLINKVLNETLEDYNNRINSKKFFKHWTSKAFYQNIEDLKIQYSFKELSSEYSDDGIFPKKSCFDNNDLIIIKQDSEKSVTNLTDLHDRVSLFIDINNIDTIRNILISVFQPKDLSYLLSIISLIKLIEDVNNPYLNQIAIVIEKEPTLFNSKEYIFDTTYIFNISYGDFSLNIGRLTDIRSYSMDDYQYTSDEFKDI